MGQEGLKSSHCKLSIGTHKYARRTKDDEAPHFLGVTAAPELPSSVDAYIGLFLETSCLWSVTSQTGEKLND